MQNRIQHAVGPLDFSAGQFPDALNDRVTVTIAFGKDGEHQGHGGGGHQFFFKFKFKFHRPTYTLHCNVCQAKRRKAFFQRAEDCGSRGREGVVVGMTSNGLTLADPNDRGMLDVVGFDTTVPAVIADFVRN